MFVACTEQLRIMEWKVDWWSRTRGVSWGSIYRLWLCGKRWKRPSVITVHSLAVVEPYFSWLLLDTLDIVSSSVGSDSGEQASRQGHVSSGMVTGVLSFTAAWACIRFTRARFISVDIFPLLAF